MASRVVRHSKPNPRPNECVNVCYLCGEKGEDMTKYSNWKNEEKEFMLTHSNTVPPSNSDICKKDYLEAKRYQITYQNGKHNKPQQMIRNTTNEYIHNVQ